MPRKKVTFESSLKSWDDVDNALRKITETEIALESIESEMQLAINANKEAAAEKSKPLQEEIKETEKDIKAFVELNRDDIKGKTKKLNFGNVGFRKSTKLTVPTAKTESIIARLEKRGMDDCVTVTKKINKDILKQQPEDTILELGCSLKPEDNFWYETSRDPLQETN